MTPAEYPEFAAAPELPTMSEPTRIVNLFFSPKKAFADIMRKPRWWVPLLLGTIITIVFLYLFSNQVGWETYLRGQIDRSGAQMSSQQREQTLSIYRQFGPIISIVGGLIGPIMTVMVIAVVLKVLADVVMGSGIGFKKTLSAVTYGMFPGQVVSAILSLVVMYSQPPDEFQLDNPLMFHLGALVPQDSPRWMSSLASSFDLFTFWPMLLIAMGLAAGASKKSSTGKMFGILLFPWAVYVILKTGAAAAFS
jgi:hypothetical protein